MPFKRTENVAGRLVRRVEDWLDAMDARGAGSSAWRTGLLVAFVAWGISLFLYLQPIQFTPGYRPRWAEFLAQCANPLDRSVARAMLQYRITTPTIAWLLHLRGWSTVLIQYAALVANLMLVYVAVARRTRPSTALLATLAMALTFVTQWVNSFPGYPDSVSHAAASMGLFDLNPVALAVVVVLGAMNDERLITAAPFLLLWLWAGPVRPARSKIMRFALGWVAGLSVVVALRLMLKHGVIGPGIIVPFTYEIIWHDSVLAVQPFGSTWPKFLLSAFMGYRWLWLMPCLALCWRQAHVGLFFRAVFLASLLAATISCAAVLDVSRSMSFFFPAMLVSLVLLHDANAAACRRALLVILVLQVVTPTCTFIGQGLFCMWPLVYQGIRYWMGSP